MFARALALSALIWGLTLAPNSCPARGFAGGGLRAGGGLGGGSFRGGVGIGGGGFGGGMARPMPRPMPAPNWSPSMSRIPATRPSTGVTPRPIQRPSERPGIGSGIDRDFSRPSGGIDRPSQLPSRGGVVGRPGVGAGAGNGPLSGGAAAGRPSANDLGNFLETAPSKVTPADRERIQSSFRNYYKDLAAKKRGGAVAGDRLGDAATDRPERPNSSRPNVDDRIANRDQFRSTFPENRQERLQQRQDWASHVRDTWGGSRGDAWNDFKDDFGEPGWRLEYPRMANAYFRWNHPGAYWWTWSSVGAMNGWFAGWWVDPYYYDYGVGGNVYYEGDSVYCNGEPAGTAEEYAQQAQEQAAAGEEEVTTPPADGSQTEWLPLGVWALSTSEDETDPTRYMQLAVSKSGTISGTLYNTITEESRPLVGSVDKATQRACWYAADDQDVVAETGIFNLTEDQSPVLIHFGTTRSEEYLLVRVPQPEKDGSDASPSEPPGPSPR